MTLIYARIQCIIFIRKQLLYPFLNKVPSCIIPGIKTTEHQMDNTTTETDTLYEAEDILSELGRWQLSLFDVNIHIFIIFCINGVRLDPATKVSPYSGSFFWYSCSKKTKNCLLIFIVLETETLSKKHFSHKQR